MKARDVAIKAGDREELAHIEILIARIEAELEFLRMQREELEKKIKQGSPEEQRAAKKELQKIEESNPIVRTVENLGKTAVKTLAAVAIADVAVKAVAPMVVPAVKTLLGAAVALPILRSLAKAPAALAHARTLLGRVKAAPVLQKAFCLFRPAAIKNSLGAKISDGATLGKALMGRLARGFSGASSAMAIG